MTHAPIERRFHSSSELRIFPRSFICALSLDLFALGYRATCSPEKTVENHASSPRSAIQSVPCPRAMHVSGLRPSRKHFRLPPSRGLLATRGRSANGSSCAKKKKKITSSKVDSVMGSPLLQFASCIPLWSIAYPPKSSSFNPRLDSLKAGSPNKKNHSPCCVFATGIGHAARKFQMASIGLVAARAPRSAHAFFFLRRSVIGVALAPGQKRTVAP